MKGCVIVQTCDVYAKYWPGFFFSMNKYWDFDIPWPVYFCNEEILIDQPKYSQLLCGKKSYINRLIHILDSIDCDYVFYMLEDFWPTDRMSRSLFMDLFDVFQQNNMDSLRVSTYLPAHYKVEQADISWTHQDKPIFKYSKDSNWRYSQQAGFWKKDFLRKILTHPVETEESLSTSLAAEIACDRYLKQNYPDSKIYHCHYFWYPISGTVWRGELSLIGQQIEVVMNIENVMKQLNIV